MKKRILTCIAIIFLALLNSCATKPLESPGFEPIDITISDIDFSIHYLPEEQLTELYGKDVNIFANFPGLFPRKKTVVFRLDIQSNSQVFDLNSKEIVLTIGETNGISKTKKQLLRSWDFYLREDNNDLKAKKMTNERMFADSVSIEPGQTYTGWLVFLESYPDEGDSFLTLSITLANDEELLLEVPLSFETDGSNKIVLPKFLKI